MIIPVYQPLGASSHQLAARVGHLYGEKATHTGTLDPMAEGVLIVLTGEDRFKKKIHSDVKKTYEFEILIGFSTDSLDLLGLITKNVTSTLNLQSMLNTISLSLKSIQKNREQLIPSFSAKRIGGGSYFDKARSFQELPSVYEPIHIYELSVLSQKKIGSTELLRIIYDKISLVQGDFRQGIILKTWAGNLNNSENQYFTVIKCTALTSKRTYIRAIVRDLSVLIGVPCTTFSISRIQNGNFSIKDCICIL